MIRSGILPGESALLSGDPGSPPPRGGGAHETVTLSFAGEELVKEISRDDLMLAGELRSQIDRLWDAFWSVGISNPLEVMEQITYPLFLRGEYDLQTLEENKPARLKQPIERLVFPEGEDPTSAVSGAHRQRNHPCICHYICSTT